VAGIQRSLVPCAKADAELNGLARRLARRRRRAKTPITMTRRTTGLADQQAAWSQDVARRLSGHRLHHRTRAELQVHDDPNGCSAAVKQPAAVQARCPYLRAPEPRTDAANLAQAPGIPQRQCAHRTSRSPSDQGKLIRGPGTYSARPKIAFTGSRSTFASTSAVCRTRAYRLGRWHPRRRTSTRLPQRAAPRAPGGAGLVLARVDVGCRIRDTPMIVGIYRHTSRERVEGGPVVVEVRSAPRSDAPR